MRLHLQVAEAREIQRKALAAKAVGISEGVQALLNDVFRCK